jgi:predicted MFS family arabinose efflux permease
MARRAPEPRLTELPNDPETIPTARHSRWEDKMTYKRRRSILWTVAITSVALFMVSLDNLVVTTALPVIRHNLHASISQLEWTVNAYTLTFAVLLLTGAALGDRFGRRPMFALGLLLFTCASAAAALSTSANALDIARAVQGVGAAVVTPLTLTILSAAVPRERRGLALGVWGGIGGLAIAIGPLVGGAIVNGVSWHARVELERRQTVAREVLNLVELPLAARALDGRAPRPVAKVADDDPDEEVRDEAKTRPPRRADRASGNPPRRRRVAVAWRGDPGGSPLP